jgi:hypothetical protein
MFENFMYVIYFDYYGSQESGVRALLNIFACGPTVYGGSGFEC